MATLVPMGGGGNNGGEWMRINPIAQADMYKTVMLANRRDTHPDMIMLPNGLVMSGGSPKYDCKDFVDAHGLTEIVNESCTRAIFPFTITWDTSTWDGHYYATATGGSATTGIVPSEDAYYCDINIPAIPVYNPRTNELVKTIAAQTITMHTDYVIDLMNSAPFPSSTLTVNGSVSKIHGFFYGENDIYFPIIYRNPNNSFPDSSLGTDQYRAFRHFALMKIDLENETVSQVAKYSLQRTGNATVAGYGMSCGNGSPSSWIEDYKTPIIIDNIAIINVAQTYVRPSDNKYYGYGTELAINMDTFDMYYAGERLGTSVGSASDPYGPYIGYWRSGNAGYYIPADQINTFVLHNGKYYSKKDLMTINGKTIKTLSKEIGYHLVSNDDSYYSGNSKAIAYHVMDATDLTVQPLVEIPTYDATTTQQITVSDNIGYYTIIVGQPWMYRQKIKIKQ